MTWLNNLGCSKFEPSLKVRWFRAQDLLWITTPSDHRRLWTANLLHTMQLSNPIGHDVAYLSPLKTENLFPDFSGGIDKQHRGLVCYVTALYVRGSQFKASCRHCDLWSVINLVHDTIAGWTNVFWKFFNWRKGLQFFKKRISTTEKPFLGFLWNFVRSYAVFHNTQAFWSRLYQEQLINRIHISYWVNLVENWYGKDPYNIEWKLCLKNAFRTLSIISDGIFESLLFLVSLEYVFRKETMMQLCSWIYNNMKRLVRSDWWYWIFLNGERSWLWYIKTQGVIEVFFIFQHFLCVLAVDLLIFFLFSRFQGVVAKLCF